VVAVSTAGGLVASPIGTLMLIAAILSMLLTMHAQYSPGVSSHKMLCMVVKDVRREIINSSTINIKILVVGTTVA
jgi:hypothetical protein